MAPRWPHDSPRWPQHAPKMAQDSHKMAPRPPKIGQYAKNALANFALRKICPSKFCVTQNLHWQILRYAKFAPAKKLHKLAHRASRVGRSLPGQQGGNFRETQQLRNFGQGKFCVNFALRKNCVHWGEGCFCCCCCCCCFWLRQLLLSQLLLLLVAAAAVFARHPRQRRLVPTSWTKACGRSRQRRSAQVCR